MKTISILNLKGGVAKTFTAANMAYEIYRRGYRVAGWGLAGSNRADTEYKLRRAAVLHRYCYVEYVTFWGYVEFDKRGQREPDRTL